MLKTAGIHHITAIVNDPQVHVDFYSKVLGLKLVKKTVNFDRPEVYHLYFGNKQADPGTIITFFPWPNLAKGRVGTKQVGVTSYIIPAGSQSFWENRLQDNDIPFDRTTRFNETYLQFKDPVGLQLELVERDFEYQDTSSAGGEISSKYGIQGFAGALLYSTQPNKTRDVLENVLGMKFEGQYDDYLRFKTEAEIGNTIDIKLSHSIRGLAGAGTVHHIAWRAKSHDELEKWRYLLEEKGYEPTEMKDRNYFEALYFKEDGEILFEIATDSPGFTVDEEINELGTKLMLPSWLESERKEFERKLPRIK